MVTADAVAITSFVSAADAAAVIASDFAVAALFVASFDAVLIASVFAVAIAVFLFDTSDAIALVMEAETASIAL